MSWMYLGFHIKYLLLLSDLNETRIYLTDFWKMLKYEISRESELLHADWQIDMTEIIVIFRSFAIEPKNVYVHSFETVFAAASWIHCDDWRGSESLTMKIHAFATVRSLTVRILWVLAERNPYVSVSSLYNVLFTCILYRLGAAGGWGINPPPCLPVSPILLCHAFSALG